MPKHEEGDPCPYEGCPGHLEWAEREGACYCHLSPPCHYCVERPLCCDVCGEDPEDCAEPVEKIDDRPTSQPTVRAPQPPPNPPPWSAPPSPPMTEREQRANLIYRRFVYSDEYGYNTIGRNTYRAKRAIATDPETGKVLRSTWWVVFDGSAEAELSAVERRYVEGVLAAEDRKSAEAKAYIQWPTYIMRPTT